MREFESNEVLSNPIMSHELLQQNFTFKQAEELQIKYSYSIQKENRYNLDIKDYDNIKRIMGVDISFFNKEKKEYGMACAVLWDLHENEMEHHYFAQDIIKFPYKAGFLGFRECSLLAQAIKKSYQIPDLIMCDGHGIIHPRKFGEAVHLGVALKIPTFGVAKNPFIGYSKWSSLKRKRGNKTPIWASNLDCGSNLYNEILGNAICLADNVKPVFISVGYKTTLNLSMAIALQLSKGHRQPEPLYLADQLSRVKIKNLL